MAYAARTKVEVDQTRYELEKTLKRYGATSFSYGTDDERHMAAIMFRAHDRFVRFRLALPSLGDKELRRSTPNATRNAVAQEERRRWRALLLAVKAKLESVESKIETFEEAFMAHVVLPDGKTAGEWLKPQLAIAYESGSMPQNLLSLPAPPEEKSDGLA